ncbi:hypothetical protein Tco_0830858 [Tanacetum coccineum]
MNEQSRYKQEKTKTRPKKAKLKSQIRSSTLGDIKFLSSIVVRRSDKKEYTFSYADLPRLNLNDIEDMYLLKVQDKLHHLQSEFEKDFNNVLLLFIRRTVILNRKAQVPVKFNNFDNHKLLHYQRYSKHDKGLGQGISSIIDLRLSQIVLGKPFIEVSNMTHDLSSGVKGDTESVYFRNEEDKRRGVDYVMSKILGFYKECLELEPEYLTGLEDEGGVT